MKHFHTRWPILLAALLISSCSSISRQTPLALVASTAYSAQWKAGFFEVSFLAGKRVFSSDNAPSRFQIVRKLVGEPDKSVAAECYLSEEAAAYAKDAALSQEIRVFVDPLESLVIEVNIPNEAGPWKNYILVTTGSDGELAVKYPNLPERKYSNSGIDYEYPEITGIGNGLLTWRYSKDGLTVSKKFSKVPFQDHPSNGP